MLNAEQTTRVWFGRTAVDISLIEVLTARKRINRRIRSSSLSDGTISILLAALRFEGGTVDSMPTPRVTRKRRSTREADNRNQLPSAKLESITERLTARQAAAILGVDAITMTAWRLSGCGGPAYRTDGSQVFYVQTDLAQWLGRNAVVS